MSRLYQQLKNQLGVGSHKTVELDSIRELQEQLDKSVQEIRISRQLLFQYVSYILIYLLN